MTMTANKPESSKPRRVSTLTVILVALGIGLLLFLLFAFAIGKAASDGQKEQKEADKAMVQKAMQDMMNNFPKSK